MNWWEVREFLLVKDVTGSTRGELSAVTIGALLQNVKFKICRIHYITCAIYHSYGITKTLGIFIALGMTWAGVIKLILYRRGMLVEVDG